MLTRHCPLALLLIGGAGAAATPRSCPAKQTFIAVARADGEPLASRIELVPEVEARDSEDCDTDETGTDCSFDDSAVTIPTHHRTVSTASRVGWANTVDGGVCLPTALVGRSALRFAGGQVSVSGFAIEVPLLRPVVVNVHADGGPVEAEVLVRPANLLGRTDGGVWTGTVLGWVSEVSVVPVDPNLLPREVRASLGKNPNTAGQSFSVGVSRPLAPPAVQVRGGVEGNSVSVHVHGWNDIALAHDGQLTPGSIDSIDEA